jgi:hypothetical protein
MASTSFQQSLSDPTIPSAVKRNLAGSASAPAHASPAAQIAVGLSKFIGPITALIEEVGDDNLAKSMIEKFSALQTARDQGSSVGEIDLRRNTYIDRLRSDNPTKLDIINKITTEFYGFNPRHVQAAAESKLTLAQETLGRQLLGEGEFTREDYITKGAWAQYSAKKMEADIRKNNLIKSGIQATAAEKELKTNETADKMTHFSLLVGEEALNTLTIDLANLTSNVGDPNEDKIIDDMMDRTINTVNAWSNTTINTVRERLFSGHPAYDNVDKSSVLKQVTESVTQMKTEYISSLTDAKKNGYLADMGETIKMFEARAQITAIHAMPIVMGLTSALGPRIAQGFFLDLSVTKQLAPDVVQGIKDTIQAFKGDTRGTLEQRRGALLLTLQSKISLSSGKTKVLDMKTQEERQEALKHHAKVYVRDRDDTTKGPRKSADGSELFPNRHMAVQSAQEDMIVTALDPTVTTAKSMREVTKFIDSNWARTLEDYKDVHKAELIAKGSQTLLVREFSHEQSNVRGWANFNKQTGKYEANQSLLNLKDADSAEGLTGSPTEQARAMQIMRKGVASLTRGKKAYLGEKAKKTKIAEVQASIDNLNANLGKQWLFRKYSPAMTKATSLEQWSEAMHSTSALYGRIPYVKGQSASKGIEKVLQTPEGEAFKENKLVFETQAANIAGRLSSAEKSIRDRSIYFEEVEEPGDEVTDEPRTLQWKGT